MCPKAAFPWSLSAISLPATATCFFSGSLSYLFFIVDTSSPASSNKTSSAKSVSFPSILFNFPLNDAIVFGDIFFLWEDYLNFVMSI
jgi:hypothetical protein